jgi:hypothetical protein
MNRRTLGELEVLNHVELTANRDANISNSNFEGCFLVRLYPLISWFAAKYFQPQLTEFIRVQIKTNSKVVMSRRRRQDVSMYGNCP